MLRILQQESMVKRAAGIIEKSIRRGEWQRRLPSERVLCEQLGISRTTLELALNTLGRKGLIRSVPRVGHLIAGSRALPAHRDSKIIRILAARPYQEFENNFRVMLSEVENMLAKGGYSLRFHHMPYWQSKSLGRFLSRLVKNEPAACWGIASVQRETQQWFQAHRIPTLVMGHCYPGVKLPAIDMDARAMYRHAVTMLLRLGHRNIVLLTPWQKTAGELHGEIGFREGFDRMATNARHEVWYHDAGAESVRHMIKQRYSKPRYPSGMIVAISYCAVAAAGCLAQLGLFLGRQVSMICRDHDEVLDWFTPPIAGYVFNRTVYAHRVARILLRLAQSGHARPGPLLFPRLNMGGSVGRPVSSR